MSIKINKQSILVVSQNQISANLSSDFSGDVVILGLQDGIYYELKEVGARIWDLIQKPRSIQAILDTLLEEYEVEAQQCEAHVLALAGDMAKRGLINIK